MSVDLKFYQSSLFGALVPGFLKGVPVAFMGRPASGKSISALQEACFLAKQVNKNVLVIGTEGGEKINTQLWAPVFMKRFALPDTFKIEVLELKTIESIMRMFGKEVELVVADSGKYDIRVRVPDGKPAINDVLEKNNIAVVVVDSITTPLRVAFSGGRMNFPARADAACMILDEFQKLSEQGYFLIATHHVSIDPTTPYARPSITGGVNIEHAFKVVLYFEKLGTTKATRRNFRKVWLVRFFNKAPWVNSQYLAISDDGVTVVTPEEVAES